MTKNESKTPESLSIEADRAAADREAEFEAQLDATALSRGIRAESLEPRRISAADAAYTAAMRITASHATRTLK
jgi:hypothetical protein